MAYLLPALCRDSTKFSRPVVPLLRVLDNGEIYLSRIVVYGNTSSKKTILYNLSDAYGVALSINVKV